MLALGEPLGDDPPRDRTSELRVLGFPGRHLGPVQMTTDTALGVTKIVVQDKSMYPRAIRLCQPILSSETMQLPFPKSHTS